ncbi:copper chaperone [Meinhardsimonia xiamenensis]|jgi:copper chaperone|uniref:Copper chaperone n=1 Tax=Meinhardsimonia xiamenensis TaxID=990712 RepID=A0A1G9BBF8_9RHOB|nr:heavy-metal-associated domain-containing protein [Meinhardsimonia xiamenensis]PRX35043.1 copper chaperone [Meinhardsimonia xiamenensis]SDK36803.1 copper chaperone [Meinhardsimonia xiamenensis]
MKFSIPDMTCGHCKAAVEKAVASVDPAARVTVDLDSHTAEVESADPVEAFVEALRQAGYEARPSA